ncbi:ribosome maturation factor RimM [Chitinilyticum litopenaei]|uniref:ribosome maturation factor RimM n=1 Tax=Chitinilyticum litopenaei TaxID=1121276 RepID=UPI000413D07C|nr:ribosome maturation factor RimM [Chitinilyticum litopenaei]
MALKSQLPRLQPDAEVPDDLVSMGYISGAFGVHGWVNVVADTEYADSLFDYETWWLGRDGHWQACVLEQGQAHAKKLAAKLAGIADRDAAHALRGCTIAVPRSAMPELGEDEFYWADLVGMRVVNTQGEALGVVSNLLSTGANDVLVIHEGKTERLLPFVAAVVLTVDQAERLITVDWGLDY